MTLAECKEEQVLELQAVTAVYEDEIEWMDCTPVAFAVSISLEDIDCDIRVSFVLPFNYPMSSAPLVGARVRCAAQLADDAARAKFYSDLNVEAQNYAGECCVYQLLEFVREWIEARHAEAEANAKAFAKPNSSASSQSSARSRSSKRSALQSSTSQTPSTGKFTDFSSFYDDFLEAARAAAGIDFRSVALEDLENIQLRMMREHCARTESDLASAKFHLRSDLWQPDAEPPDKEDDRDGNECGEAALPLPLDEPNLKRSVSSQEDFESLYGLSSEEEPFTCLVCMDEVAKFEGGGFAMACGHWACVDCWAGYVSSFVNDGNPYITCLGFKCKKPLHEEVILSILDSDASQKYFKFLRNSFVDLSQWEWCAGDKCEWCVEVKDTETERHGEIPALPLNCVHCKKMWCSACDRPPHFPATCQVQQFFDDYASGKVSHDKLPGRLDHVEQKTVEVYINVKECPKCKTQWEKIDGCNHIHCRKCDHHFCWVCLLPFGENHTDFYNCPRSEKGTKKVKIEEETAEAKQAWIDQAYRITAHESLKSRAEFHGFSAEAAELYLNAKGKIAILRKAIGKNASAEFVINMLRFMRDAHNVLVAGYTWLFGANVVDQHDGTPARMFLHQAEYNLSVLRMLCDYPEKNKKNVIQLDSTMRQARRHLVYFAGAAMKKNVEIKNKAAAKDEKPKDEEIVPMHTAVLQLLRAHQGRTYTLEEICQSPELPRVRDKSSRKVWSALAMLTAQGRIKCVHYSRRHGGDCWSIPAPTSPDDDHDAEYERGAVYLEFPF